MNERIKELANQAELTIHTGRGNTYVSHPEFNKKFAELIVREFTDLCNQWPDTVRQIMQRQIKEHFGVEE